LLKQIG